ncbi:hypothetical protein AKJ39_04980 [candidate division MSBL1 archaeon SCGC-AAA259J03]|uniref:PIN domain-containing protein n=1 Tax=candidate division MSBL1 archaeon SCGC-AAA259J03 TaxID=1698269 RepID=A0A656YV26_9EURY|nr:hypothetical protein AKJ39_04980 [candidate division MSBL1 archaeon SCGC-AAA259J03]
MNKKLEDLSSGSIVFIDSNLLIYEFSSHPKYGVSSRNFLEKVEKMELLGVTSVTVLDEVLYKSMLIELSKKEDINVSEASVELRENPEKIQKLDTSITNSKELLEMPIHVLGVTQNIFASSIENIKRYNLRPHDAAIVETLNFYGIENIATNDPDFDSVDWLHVFKPRKREDSPKSGP